MSQPTDRRTGRPRDTAVDQRVLDAAGDLLHAAGYSGLSIDEVAARAGTAKTTLYRRWPTKDHLAVAVAARILGDVPIASTGNLRRDLTDFAAALAESLNRIRLVGQRADNTSAGLAAEIVAAAARHPDIGDAVHAGFAERHALALARLRSAQDNEGLKPDVDAAVLIDQIAGPVYYRILITGEPADRGYAGRLVNAVLDGASTPKETGS